MKKILGLVVVLGLAASPAFAQKVVLDYAHDFDFRSIKTYHYVDTAETNIRDSLMADRVVSAIKEALGARGLSEVQENPDLLVTYHYSAQDNQVFSTTTMGMGGAGMGAGWGRWGAGGMGMATSTTRASTYTEGTLVIDAYEPEEQKLLWRGSSTVTVKSKPDAQMKQVKKILDKLGKKWDKILAGMGE